MLKKQLKAVISRRPDFFWQFWGKRVLADPWQRRIFSQHRWLLRQIRQLKPASILEVGCGFGRNLNWLIKQGIDQKILTGADISAKLLSQADLPVRLVRANALCLPFSDRQFDLVFTHGLLMHLPPRQLPRALGELIRVSRKRLILIEEVRSRPRKLNYFTWAHDYDKILAALAVEVIKQTNQPHNIRCYLLEKLNTATGASLTPENF